MLKMKVFDNKNASSKIQLYNLKFKVFPNVLDKITPYSNVSYIFTLDSL